MTEQTQTEKLRGKIDAISKAKELLINTPGDLAPFIDQVAIEKNYIDQILQACKEAGLKFVPEKWNIKVHYNWDAHPEYFDGQNDVMEAINSQIKELEIEQRG